jgi:hypothetical protein
MEIRYLDESDKDEVNRIYDAYFKDMDFPNFYNNYYSVFVVEDDNKKVIAIGGVKSIIEAVVLTDQGRSVRDRMEALLRIFEGVKYVGEKLDYPQIHVFAYDNQYTEHLINRMGFKCNKENKVLTLDLKNG